MVDKQTVISLLSELVKIDSVNPWLVKGGAGEHAVAKAIAAWLEPVGVEITLDEVEDGRNNLVARLPGRGEGKSLALNAHLDTVGCAPWKERAFIPRLEGNRMVGLGSADDKGHCAVALLAMKALAQSGDRLGGDLYVALTVDEEGASIGTSHFVAHYHPDAALVLEPFGLGFVTVTHQGFGWLDVIVEGNPAHGSSPQTGVDAIAHMAEVITRLQRLYDEVYTPQAHPLNGVTVFHASTIEGGTDYATYPGGCRLGIEIGTQPGETIQARLDEIQAIFDQVRAAQPKFRGRVEVRLARNPFEAHGHERLLSILDAEFEKVLGKPLQQVGENAWADAALFQEAGIPTLMLGASGKNFHAPDEWVNLDELVTLEGIIENTARQFCA